MPFVYRGIDYYQARKELEDYIKSLPENSRWKDFVETSTGSHILDLLAGLAVYLRHSVGIARREAYVSSARLYNSLVAIANTLAYPVNRPNALVLEIDVVPNETRAWNKEDPIGNIGGVPLVLTKDTSFNTGVGVTIQVAAGEWKSYTFATDNSPFQKYFIEGIIDNFLYQLVDAANNVIPTRRYLEDFDPQGVVEVTAPGGVHLMSGEGRFARKFSGETYTFRWVQPIKGDFSGTPTLDLDASIVDVRILRSYSDGDSIEKLATVIPGYHAARARAVTLWDHRYIIMAYKGSIVDGTVVRGPGCCEFYLTYLNVNDLADFTGDWRGYFRNRYVLLSSTEMKGLIDFVRDRALVGMRYRVANPLVTVVDVRGRLYVDPASERDLTDIRKDVEDLFIAFRTDLGQNFYVGEITAMLGKIEGIERVYVDSPTEDRKGNWNEVFVVAPDFTIEYAN